MAVETFSVNVQAVSSISNSKAIPSLPELRELNSNREVAITPNDMDAKLAELNSAMAMKKQTIVFSTDPQTGIDVVTITDKNTGDIIRQMPSIEVLSAMENIDLMVGVIFNQEA